MTNHIAAYYRHLAATAENEFSRFNYLDAASRYELRANLHRSTPNNRPSPKINALHFSEILKAAFRT